MINKLLIIFIICLVYCLFLRPNSVVIEGVDIGVLEQQTKKKNGLSAKQLIELANQGNNEAKNAIQRIIDGPYIDGIEVLASFGHNGAIDMLATMVVIKGPVGPGGARKAVFPSAKQAFDIVVKYNVLKHGTDKANELTGLLNNKRQKEEERYQQQLAEEAAKQLTIKNAISDINRKVASGAIAQIAQQL